jgi:Xaa-Pro aminopeptidase
VSANEIVRRLRAEKLPVELHAVKKAIHETERIFEIIEPEARELLFEKRVFDRIQGIVRARGFGFAWDPTGDPIVNSGPDSMVGHGIPSETIAISPGHIFHIDLGVRVDGYCSDLQRCWYVGESVPDDVQSAFLAVQSALLAAKASLAPGAQGWDVDEAARNSIKSSGYPEYLHAVGHQVGRMAHDGGTILGPKWERYGSTPLGVVRENEVYTLELGVDIAQRGYLGIEEMVVVTESGCEWLSTPQSEIWTL